MGDLGKAPGSCLRPGSVLAIVTIWGVNKLIEDLSASIPLSVTLTLKTSFILSFIFDEVYIVDQGGKSQGLEESR